MDSVKDKVVLITGASSGIGAGTAQLFAKYGAKLVIGGRNEANLRKTAKCCEEEGVKADDILIVTGDMLKEEDCNDIVDKAIEKFGRLDVLVNNAGASKSGNIDMCEVQDLDFMYNLLLRSVFVLTKRAVPHLKKTKGCIVNVSTVGSIIPAPMYMAYGMVKAGVNHFTKCMAQDLGPSGVRVNCILPGAIDSGFFDAAAALSGVQMNKINKDQLMDQVSDMHALKRVGQVNEVAQLIVFLGSDAASFMTGAVVPVDGGVLGHNSF